MGRPPTRPIKFRDGFYIEIRNKGKATGIKIHRETKDQMLRTIMENGLKKLLFCMSLKINYFP